MSRTSTLQGAPMEPDDPRVIEEPGSDSNSLDVPEVQEGDRNSKMPAPNADPELRNQN